MGRNLEHLKRRLTANYFARLMRIANPALHEYVAEFVALCNPDKVVVGTDSKEARHYPRQAALAKGEEALLATPGHTIHFDSPLDQPRDKRGTQFLLPRYKDLRALFKKVLGRDYPRDAYLEQFAIRVPENLAKIDRLEKIYPERVKDTPAPVSSLFEEHRSRLVQLRRTHGDRVPPDRLEAGE
ncbi:MAG: hypothetical protein ACUVTG_10505 [Candidatus Oleimicrobiaceae bacterium]